ncbi:hypothetical protein SAY86_003854 [Trapa natans]|uniref:Polygalacturonase n=1 Tax=Trapa natans TaxID=22666 RepID=A0AAN7MTE3_TRANT|nr:hypothetical protein SAY86_003854 [Trapa natans]
MAPPLAPDGIHLIRWLVLVILVLFALVQQSSAVYNVVNYGAKPDGRTNSTLAFSRAWTAACSSLVPATLYVPKGIFMVGAITFRGPCRSRIMFQLTGTLIASSNYWSLGNSEDWILFHYVNRISIYGGGTVNAQGTTYWSCRMAGKSCPDPAKSISIQRSSNVFLSGLTSVNSKMFHIFVSRSANVRIHGVKLHAPSWSPNTDGIHIQNSKGVTVTSSLIKTGDDCISMGPGSKNIWIDAVTCGPGHGISIGSLGQAANEDGVQNVTVMNSILTGTQNGVRIKTWARAYTGYVTSVSFRNIVMRSVFNPIIIDQDYCPNNNNCPSQVH